MHFITKKTSETGQKFQAVHEKMNAARQVNREIVREVGAQKWREDSFNAVGSITSFFFEQAPDEKIFKKVNGGKEWMPRLSTKTGKEIQAKIDAAPKVSMDEVNQCIGFDGAPIYHIGFARNNEEYFGFIVREEWDVTIPSDCEEVTVRRYNELFK